LIPPEGGEIDLCLFHLHPLFAISQLSRVSYHSTGF
jgi:hypothetical protein